MALWLLRADEDFRRDCLGAPSITSGTPCGICPCTNWSVPWYDFKLTRDHTPEWVLRTYSVAEWKASGHNANELYDIDGVSHHCTVSVH